jgi:DNA-binding NarL/FixJ family response regulator
MAWLRMNDGHLAVARDILEHELDLMRRSGREFEEREAVLYLAQIETAAGNWQDADSRLDEAWQLAFDGGDRFWEAWVVLHRALLAGLRGDVEEARRLSDRSLAHGAAHWPLFAAYPRAVLGSLELSLGNAQRAWELLGDLDVDLMWFAVPAVADAIEAAVLLGRLDEAEARLAVLSATWSESEWGRAAVRRCEALVLLASGDPAAALAAADEAAARFEAAGFPFDRARSLLVTGDALRRRGERRRAADRFAAAKAIFERLDAALWRERAEQELARARPRPRSDRRLTTAEQRVATLVAAGRTNREVAAELFTTVGTVEVHLTRIYRKLGLRSRTELARRVADATLELRSD